MLAISGGIYDILNVVQQYKLHIKGLEKFPHLSKELSGSERVNFEEEGLKNYITLNTKIYNYSKVM